MAEIRVYTIDEVANILKLTSRTVYSYVRAGKLQAVKLGKYWRIPEESLQAFISTGSPLDDNSHAKEE